VVIFNTAGGVENGLNRGDLAQVPQRRHATEMLENALGMTQLMNSEEHRLFPSLFEKSIG